LFIIKYLTEFISKIAINREAPHVGFGARSESPNHERSAKKKMTPQKIDKLDAACRQLNTAIYLWSNHGDAVSIHTLACSAYQIVHDINLKKGGRDLLYDSLIFKDEHRQEVINRLKQAYNFFKHADKDPSAIVKFDPIISEAFMIFTSLGLEILGQSPDEVRGAFIRYYFLRNPHLLTEKGKTTFIDAVPEQYRKDALSMPKERFFEVYTHLRKQCV
jgi:hypothetical protein